MECKESRKRLKDYAAGGIKDELLKKEMEEHIDGCYICKKELSMWDEDLDRKKLLQELNKNLSPQNFRIRVGLRMASVDRDPNLAPYVKQLRKFSVLKIKAAKNVSIYDIIIAFILIPSLVFSVLIVFIKHTAIPFLFILFSILILFLLSLRQRLK